MQGHGDVFYIVGHTGENIAPGMRIKIFDGQLLQLDVDGLAHVIDEILGHIDHNELLNEVADHRERIEKAHDNGGVPQSGKVDAAAGRFAAYTVGDDIHHVCQLVGGIGAGYGIYDGHHKGQKDQRKLRP